MKEDSNVFTTPLRQWGFRQCLPLSWTTLRRKHCRHPIAILPRTTAFPRYRVNAINFEVYSMEKNYGKVILSFINV